MTLDGAGRSGPLRVVRVLGNGKRRFDPVEKERLVDAALEPGVSIAGLALAHGVNANQLRNWVALRRRRQASVKELTVLPNSVDRRWFRAIRGLRGDKRIALIFDGSDLAERPVLAGPVPG